jgi:hypothetical protein
MSIFELTRLLLSREDGFFHLEPNLQNHDVKPEVVVEFWIWWCLIAIFEVPLYALLLIELPTPVHQGFIYMLLTFKLLKLFRKPVVLLCDILMLYWKYV